MGRRQINNSLKRKAKPVSLSDPEYNRIVEHIENAYIGMNFSQVVRYLFEKDIQEFKSTKQIRMGVIDRNEE